MATVFYQSASELATLSNTFKVAGVATDPTTASLTVTSPSGTATTYTWAGSTLTRTGTGAFTKDVACSEAGDWQGVWTGTGTASDVEPVTWTVFDTELGHLYATVSALKSRLGITSTDTTDDYEIHMACWAVSRAIEHYTQRLFYRSATGTARTFEACNPYRLDMPDFCDLVSVSALATDASGDGTFETTWSSSDYQLLPVNPAAAPETKPYTRIKAIGSYTFPLGGTTMARDDRVQVTGVYGWPAIPFGVKQGALIWAEDTFRMKDSKLGAIFGEFGAMRVRENPIAMGFCSKYQRQAVLVG